ncbi:tail fiber assembly protein [Enterobacter roggenkampii]|uniref:tail fiber assembly protein n=1 Tax=Enterobacter roggenkampii TaxID=1812935 RepID=UPI00321A2062
MAGLFDKNGNATETHIATVSGFDPVTGEHIATYEVRIFAGTGIPGFSTLSLAPAKESGYAYCWNGSSWQKVIDLRNSIVYEKSTGDQVTVKTLGPLDDSLTVMPTPEELHKNAVREAENRKAQLLAEAAQYTRDWQTDLLLGIITDEDKARLIAWMNYIKAVQAVDTSKAPDITWPTPPADDA